MTSLERRKNSIVCSKTKSEVQLLAISENTFSHEP